MPKFSPKFHKNISPKDYRLLLAYLLGKSLEEIYFADDLILTPVQQKKLDNFIQRRQAHEPLSKIIQRREFWGLDFRVTKDTLDPRADSETIIQAIVDDWPLKDIAFNVLDLGTGSGCLLLSVLTEFPNAKGVGIDISSKALKIAEENAHNLGLKARSHFFMSNWGEDMAEKFDVIISNPPYIAPTEFLEDNVRHYDPALALFGGEDGLESYRSLALTLSPLLSSNGRIYLEIGSTQKKAVLNIFSKIFKSIIVKKDLAGNDRCLILFH